MVLHKWLKSASACTASSSHATPTNARVSCFSPRWLRGGWRCTVSFSASPGWWRSRLLWRRLRPSGRWWRPCWSPHPLRRRPVGAERSGDQSVAQHTTDCVNLSDILEVSTRFVSSHLLLCLLGLITSPTSSCHFCHYGVKFSLRIAAREQRQYTHAHKKKKWRRLDVGSFFWMEIFSYCGCRVIYRKNSTA